MITRIEKAWPDWQVERLLGKGSYGVVYQVVRRDAGFVSRAAVKVISIPSDPSEVDSLRAEGIPWKLKALTCFLLIGGLTVLYILVGRVIRK